MCVGAKVKSLQYYDATSLSARKGVYFLKYLLNINAYAFEKD